MSLWALFLERACRKSNAFFSNCFTFLFLKPRDSVTHLGLTLADGVKEDLTAYCTVPVSAASLDDEAPPPHSWTPPLAMKRAHARLFPGSRFGSIISASRSEQSGETGRSLGLRCEAPGAQAGSRAEGAGGTQHRRGGCRGRRALRRNVRPRRCAEL